MKNYIENIVGMLSDKLDWYPMDTEVKNKMLLNMYAVLVLTKGEDTTDEDVHDAWSASENTFGNINHRSIIPFDELTKEVQKLDEPYTEAIRQVARQIKKW